MIFTPRTQQILNILLEDGPIGKQEIADRLGISKRTVQREFESMDRDLLRYGIRITAQKGAGVQLLGSGEALQKLKKELGEQADTDPVSREARRKRLLFEMLRDRTPRKLYYYSQLLGVSEATAGSDMDAICPWLEKSRLGIIRRPGYGVLLEGTEEDYRAAMRRFIEENAGLEEQFAGLAGAEKSGDAFTDALLNAADTGIYSLLEGDTVRRVDQVLRGLNEPKILQLADSAYAGLVIHIAIVIERLRQGAALENIPEEMGDLQFWEDYDLAVRILEAMEAEFGLTIPRGELSYVLLHIRGAKIAYSGKEQAVTGELRDERLLAIIDRMIDSYDISIADQLKEDEEFLRGLLIHLRPVIVRLQSGMHIHNPILEDIRSEYPEVYEACRRAAAVLEEETGYVVSDEETGFLAMHFGAAQERLKERTAYTRKVVIGIVCASGFGVARLMMTRLAERLGSRAVLRPYGKGELNAYVIAGVDFFVSTMNLDRLPVDYVQVSPLIPPRDLETIEYKISDYSHVRRDVGNSAIGARMDDLYMVMREIKNLIRRYRRLEISSTVRFREILQFMSMQVTESLHAAAALRDGIEEREKLNTQIFPELGIGLFHCRSGAVREPVFISCVPRSGGAFTDPFLRGMQAAVLMVMPRDEHRALHAEVLGSISGAFITNAHFLQLVKKGTEEETRAELARELKCFFFDYLDKI